MRTETALGIALVVTGASHILFETFGFFLGAWLPIIAGVVFLALGARKGSA